MIAATLNAIESLWIRPYANSRTGFHALTIHNFNAIIPDRGFADVAGYLGRFMVMKDQNGHPCPDYSQHRAIIPDRGPADRPDAPIRLDTMDTRTAIRGLTSHNSCLDSVIGF